MEKSRLLALADSLELKGVRFPGFVQYDHLPAYYAFASAFVHPALSEPWGLVVNEAAASGLPLLVSRSVGAAGELVRSEENGTLFDPTSDADIARALCWISSMEIGDRWQMGARAAESVSDWSPDRFGRELLNAATLGHS